MGGWFFRHISKRNFYRIESCLLLGNSSNRLLAIQIVSPTQLTCQQQYPSQSKPFRAGRDALSFQTKQNTNYYFYKAHLVKKERVDMIQVNVQRSDQKKKKMQAATCGDISSEHLHLHTVLGGPFFLPLSDSDRSNRKRSTSRLYIVTLLI